MRATSVTQSLIDNQQMQIYSLKSQLTKANELIGKLEKSLKYIADTKDPFAEAEQIEARDALEEIAKWRGE